MSKQVVVQVDRYVGENIYEQYEKSSPSKYNRVCIDGRITGCGSCVGYCQYSGHPGFLTERLRAKHDCINKGCFYYIEKTPRKKNRTSDTDDCCDYMLSIAREKTRGMEGLKVINAHNVNQNKWRFRYVTISNEYQLSDIAGEIEKETACEAVFERLDYGFEKCAQIIFG